MTIGFVTVAMIRGAIAIVAAVVVGGCSGGEERKQVFTATDAARIANVGRKTWLELAYESEEARVVGRSDDRGQAHRPSRR